MYPRVVLKLLYSKSSRGRVERPLRSVCSRMSFSFCGWICRDSLGLRTFFKDIGKLPWGEAFAVPREDVVICTVDLLQKGDSFRHKNYKTLTVGLGMLHNFIRVCVLIVDFLTYNMQMVQIGIIFPFDGNKLW